MSAPNWKYSPTLNGYGGEILDGDRRVAAFIGDDDIGNLIVRSVNSHDDLLSACQRAFRVLKAQGESVRPGNVLGCLAAAIAKATPSTPTSEGQS